jgi:hypothetical protein
MCGHYSLSASNGESSQALQHELKHNSTPIPKTEDLLSHNPYLTMATAGPSDAKVTDPYRNPDTWANVFDKIIVPLPKEKIIDHTRLAHGRLNAQADAVPHYYYPSADFTLLTPTIIRNYAATPSILALNGGNVRFDLPVNHQDHSTKRIATPYPNKIAASITSNTASPSHFYAPGLRNRKRTHNTKSKRALPAIQKRNKLAHLKIFTKTFYCPSVAARAPGDTRPLIKFYSKRVLNPKRPRFYRKRFLAGPPEKTEVKDNRIFYVREFLCADKI